jgi:hypothetical protein
MSLADDIRPTLAAAGIRHVLVGALALSAHGVNRATVDSDLFTTDTLLLGIRFLGRPAKARRRHRRPEGRLDRFSRRRGAAPGSWRERHRRRRREALLADEGPRASRAHRRGPRGPGREVELRLSDLPTRCQELWKEIRGACPPLSELRQSAKASQARSSSKLRRASPSAGQEDDAANGTDDSVADQRQVRCAREPSHLSPRANRDKLHSGCDTPYMRLFC